VESTVQSLATGLNTQRTMGKVVPSLLPSASAPQDVPAGRGLANPAAPLLSAGALPFAHPAGWRSL
jgi:hypothetical protein